MTDIVVQDGASGTRKHRIREVRRGEYAFEVAIADAAIPGSGLFFSTDNELMIAPRKSVLAINTEGSTLDSQWTAALSGTGSATQGAGQLRLRTGATANSTSRVTSRTVRRRAGATQYYISVWWLDNVAQANVTRRWGMYDDNNGFFFEHDSVNGLRVASRKAGVDTYVAGSAMNGPTLVGDFDLSKLNQFNIFYGGLSCRWHVNGRVLHAIGTNTLSSPLTESVNLPMRAETVNTGGSTVDNSLYGRGVSFHSVSPLDIVPQYRMISTAATTVVSVNAGTLRRIALNNPGPGGTVTLYDNTAASGTQVGIISVPGSANNPFMMEYDIEFQNGLTVVTSSAMNITVVFD